MWVENKLTKKKHTTVKIIRNERRTTVEDDDGMDWMLS